MRSIGLVLALCLAAVPFAASPQPMPQLGGDGAEGGWKPPYLQQPDVLQYPSTQYRDVLQQQLSRCPTVIDLTPNPAAPLGGIPVVTAPVVTVGDLNRRLRDMTSNTSPWISDSTHRLPPRPANYGSGPTPTSSNTTPNPQDEQAAASGQDWNRVVRDIFEDCYAAELKAAGDSGRAIMCIGERASRVCGTAQDCRQAVRARVRREFQV